MAELREIGPEQLKEILEDHRKWVETWMKEEREGKRADLQKADLSGAYLEGANLQEAILVEAKLRGANLSGAKLQKADLRYARGLEALQVKLANN